MAATHRTAYTIAALALATGDADMDRIVKHDSLDELTEARRHLFDVDRALTRAIAAIEIDAASTRPEGATHV